MTMWRTPKWWAALQTQDQGPGTEDCLYREWRRATRLASTISSISWAAEERGMLFRRLSGAAIGVEATLPEAPARLPRLVVVAGRLGGDQVGQQALLSLEEQARLVDQ